MTDNGRNIDWLTEEQRYFDVYDVTQMRRLRYAVYQELGITTAEEFVAWFDDLKALISQLPGGDTHETHSDDGGLSLCVRSVQPEQVADGAEEQDSNQDAERRS